LANSALRGRPRGEHRYVSKDMRSSMLVAVMKDSLLAI